MQNLKRWTVHLCSTIERPANSLEDGEVDADVERKEKMLVDTLEEARRQNLGLIRKYLECVCRIQERVGRDEVQSVGDFAEESNKVQKEYLRSKIVKLEYQQLAESITCIKIKKCSSNALNYARSCAEYEITFDKSIRVPPTQVDATKVKTLNKYRRRMFSVPDDNADFNNESLNFEESPSVKQITDLFDEGILNRELDFTKYGLCHYCKRIKPSAQLLRCGNENGSDNACSKPFPVIHLGSGEETKASSNTKKAARDGKGSCHRLFCAACLETKLHISFKDAESDGWVCPCCSGSFGGRCAEVCGCSRCARQREVLRCREQFFSLGGTGADLEKPVKLLSRYAAANFPSLRAKAKRVNSGSPCRKERRNCRNVKWK